MEATDKAALLSPFAIACEGADHWKNVRERIAIVEFWVAICLVIAH